MRTAIIIKGNPKFIKNNTLAEHFYEQLARVVSEQGYSVTFDAGEPYTTPVKADLWIGHSRGCDRLRFAPEGTRTIAMGSASDGAINHPQDNTIQTIGESDVEPNEFHYTITETIINELKKRLA